jgi:hypothetical protein
MVISNKKIDNLPFYGIDGEIIFVILFKTKKSRSEETIFLKICSIRSRRAEPQPQKSSNFQNDNVEIKTSLSQFTEIKNFVRNEITMYLNQINLCQN